MAVRLTIEVDRQAVISTFTGEINDADLLSVHSLIRSHPDFDPDFSEILDFSGVCPPRQSSRRHSAPSNFNPTSKHIVVAPQDHIFGLAPMSQVFPESTRPNAAVVRTIEQARKLLGSRNVGE
jgi:hypothetical protein